MSCKAADLATRQSGCNQAPPPVSSQLCQPLTGEMVQCEVLARSNRVEIVVVVGTKKLM